MRILKYYYLLAKRAARNRHSRAFRRIMLAALIASSATVGSWLVPRHTITISAPEFLAIENKIVITVGSDEAYAATESLYPTGEVLWSNLSGSYLDIDDDPDSPDGTWANAGMDSFNTIAHVSFDTPTANLSEGADLQTFKVYAKRSTALSTPTIRIDLYESGGLVTSNVLAATDVTTDSGAIYSGTWNAAALSNIDGSGVECYIYGAYSGVSDPPSVWTTPTGDTANGWSSSSNAWDDDTGTYALYDIAGVSYSPYLEFSISEISCDSVRVWSTSEKAGTNVDTIQVDVYYNSTWNNIYSGSYTQGQFDEYPIGSEQNVTGMRVRYYNNHGTQSREAYCHEVDFAECPDPTFSSVSYDAVEWIADYSTCSPNITNTPDNENLGTVEENSTVYAYGSAPSNPVQDGECTFTLTNNSGGAADITIQATNFTGGDGWTLVSGSPGSGEVRMTAYYSGQDPSSGVVMTTSPQSFISALGDSTAKKWDFKLEIGTLTDGVAKQSTITLAATCS